MTEEKKVLNVGCGPKESSPLPHMFCGTQWREVRLDINPAVKPNYVSDIRDMPVVSTGSMDGLWSSHNIEHLYAHEVPRALGEFHRVLKEGGLLAMGTPDIQRVAQFVAAGNLEEPLYVSPAGPISAVDIMYGFRPSMAAGNLFMAHKTAFTAASLARQLMASGFSEVTIVRKDFNLFATAWKRAELSQPRNQYRLVDEGGPAPTVSVTAA
jgi:SAM-dependent methyltransferase